MATATIKEHFRDIKRGRPGRRFEDHYQHEKKARHGHNSVGRIVRLVLGIVLVGAGVVFCLIPGPGLPLIFLGGALLAAESLAVAKAMDWLEVRLRAAWRWGKAHWDRLPLGGKIAVATVVVLGAAGAAWLAWRLLRG